MQKKSIITVSPISYVYFALFFISGISGLIYESIWSQYLKQFLGHAAYAQTLVLVIYMGGMALGSWLAAWGVTRIRNLLLGYAVVEIALGGLALIFHNVFIAYLDASFDVVIPLLGKPLPIELYKWVSASLIILPQSMLLGATFPLMAGGILRRFPGLSGYKTSFIYFVNTFGASIGVLISGFYLVKEWGLRGAIISGGLIDLFVGCAILALCLNDKKAAYTGKNITDAAVDTAAVDTDAIDTDTYINTNSDVDVDTVIADTGITGKDDAVERRKYYHVLLFVAATTAMASFIYEIAWIRMLSLVLGSSTHSFELMLSAFILGLALGSFFVRNRLDTIKNAPRFLGIVQVIMGATAILTLAVYGNMFRFMVFTLEGLDQTSEGYVFYNIISHVICMIMMLPSTICAGMVIPLIIHMLYKRGHGEAAIGKVYAINTAGGILGVVVAVWVLMELVGLKYLIIIGGTIDMALGLFVLWRFKETRATLTRTLMQPVALLMLVAGVAFFEVDPVLASSGVFRYGTISTSKSVIGHIDGRTASITMFRSGDNIVLSTNGKPDASVGTEDEFSSDEYTMALLGVLPLSVHPNPRTAAVIGLGAGMTSHFMLYDPVIERLDVVEIERAMIKLVRIISNKGETADTSLLSGRAAKKFFNKVGNNFTDPRCNIHVEDAKTFFSSQSRTYDVIVSEPSNPWVSGVSSLFSKEFFRRIRNHLNDGGILMQWFHTYEADVMILSSILKALGESFPQYELYLAGSDLLIIAAKDTETDISIKRDLFIYDRMGDHLKEMGITGMDDLKLLRYGSKEFLGPFVNTFDVPANSDYHSYVDHYAVKRRYMGQRVEELDEIREFIIPIQKIVFADTGFLSFAPRTLMPQMYNLQEIDNARTLAQEIIISATLEETITSDEITSSLLTLNNAYHNPQRATFWQVQRAIWQILDLTLPYLSASEMREVWEVIEAKLVNMDLDAEGQKWIEYFRALCTYDKQAMRTLSLGLLPETETFSSGYINQMLLSSLLASSTALGDTTNIDRVWSRYTDRHHPPSPVRAAKALWQARNR